MKKPFLLLFILWSLSGRAQDSTQPQKTLLVDKLTNHIYNSVYTASIVPEGLIQVDVDLVYLAENDKSRSSLTKFRSASLPELKVRYGISSQLEVRAGTRIGYAYQMIDLSPLSTSDPVLTGLLEQSVIHTDYIVLGFKASLLNYNQQKGELSVLAEANLPVLRPKEAFGPAFYPNLTLINANQLNHWLGYNLNAGAIFNRENRDQLIGAYHLSISPTFVLTDYLGSYAGINKVFEANSQLAHFKGFTYTAGLLYSAAPSLQLRGSFSLQRRNAWSLNKYNYNLGIAWQPDYL